MKALHQGSLRADDASRRSRGAPGSVGLRPPSPGASNSPPCTRVGWNENGDHQVRIVDKGPGHTQDLPSREGIETNRELT